MEARHQSLIGPDVIKNALPFLGGGLVLTAVGTFGGLSVMGTNPAIFMPTFWVALIGNFVLFFVAMNVAQQGNNSTALPLLAVYSLLSGYTLSGLVALALGTSGVGIGGIGVAALGCGITFILAQNVGSNLSEEDGIALGKTVTLGMIALIVVLLLQVVLSIFGVITPTFLEASISGFGVLLFVGVSVVDFFSLPRTYRNEQYLAAALSMYLTYINLFVFILRFLIAINSRD